MEENIIVNLNKFKYLYTFDDENLYLNISFKQTEMDGLGKIYGQYYFKASIEKPEQCKKMSLSIKHIFFQLY
jgi:hypothetical protein